MGYKRGYGRGGGAGTGVASGAGGGGGTPAIHLEQNGNAELGLVLGLQHEEAGPDWGFFATARRPLPHLPQADLTGQTGGSRVRVFLPETLIRPSEVTTSGSGQWNMRVIQGQPAVAEVAATSASFDIRTSATVNKGIRVTLAPGANGSDVSFSIQRITTGSISRNISNGRVLQVFILSTSTAAEVLGQFYTTAGDTTSGLAQLALPNAHPTNPGGSVNIQSVAYFGPAGDVEDGTSVIGGLTISQIAGRTVGNNLNVNFVPSQHGTSGTDGTPAITRAPLSANFDLANQRIEITAISTDTLNQIAAIIRPLPYPIRVDFDLIDGYSDDTAGNNGGFAEAGLVTVNTGTSTLNAATFFSGAVGDHVDVAFAAGINRDTLLVTANATAETITLRYHTGDSIQTLVDYLNERQISDANVTLYASEIYGTNLSSGAEAPPINGRPFVDYYPEGSAGSGGATSTSSGLDQSQVDARINTIVDKDFVDNLDVDADTLDGQEGSYYLDYDNFINTPTIPTSNNSVDVSDPKSLVSTLEWHVDPAQLTGRGITDFERTFRLEFERPFFDLSSYYFEVFIGGQMVHARTQWASTFTHFDAIVNGVEATAIVGGLSSNDHHFDVEIRFFEDSTSTTILAITSRRLLIVPQYPARVRVLPETIDAHDQLQGSYTIILDDLQANMLDGISPAINFLSIDIRRPGGSNVTVLQPSWTYATRDQEISFNINAAAETLIGATSSTDYLIFEVEFLGGGSVLTSASAIVPIGTDGIFPASRSDIPEEATETTAGIVEKATSDEMTEGTADKFPDAAIIKTYVDASIEDGGTTRGAKLATSSNLVSTTNRQLDTDLPNVTWTLEPDVAPLLTVPSTDTNWLQFDIGSPPDDVIGLWFVSFVGGVEQDRIIHPWNSHILADKEGLRFSATSRIVVREQEVNRNGFPTVYRLEGGATTIPANATVEVYYAVASGAGGGSANTTSSLTQAQQIGLLHFTSDVASLQYSGELSDALEQTFRISVANPEVLTGDIWVEGNIQGLGALSRTKWASNIANLDLVLSSPNADTVAEAIDTNNDMTLDLDLRFHSTSSGDNLVDVLKFTIPIINTGNYVSESEFETHENNASAHQDSPRRQSFLDISAPVGREIYLTQTINHPGTEHIFVLPLGALGPSDNFIGASVIDFSGNSGPEATADTSGFPAVMNAARVAGIWQNNGGLDNFITIAVEESIGIPTHINLGLASGHVRSALTQNGSNITVAGNDYRIMRTDVTNLRGQLEATVNNMASFSFSLEYATGFIESDGTIDTGTDFEPNKYVSIGNGQWIPITLSRSPNILQEAVNGGDSAGVTLITLPSDYTNWRFLSISMWGQNEDRIGGTSLRTSLIATQTANRVFVVSGNLEAGGRGSMGSLTWTRNSRTLASVNNDRIIYAELHD